MRGRTAFSLSAVLVTAFVVAACTSMTPSPTPVPAKSSGSPAGPTAAPARLTPSVAAAPTTAAPAPSAMAYPTKPLNFLIPWPAGDVTDVGSRVLTGVAEKYFGQPIVVVNKPGAGSQVGLTELAGQKPDGYTIAMVSFPRFNTIVLDPERKANFSLESFTPIMSHVLDPGTIYVKADSPYKTLKDLLDNAKMNPQKIRLGGTSLFSDDHLLCLMLQEATGAEFNIIHFDGGAPQLAALMGGHIDVASDNVGFVASRVKTGELRVLAVADKERSKFIPEAPTAAELGYPNVTSSSFRAIMGPKGMPASVLAKIQESFGKAMQDPAHVENMEKQGFAIKALMGEDLSNYLKDMHERTKPVIELALKSSK